MNDDDREILQRRATLAHSYQLLPLYASEAFWLAISDVALPLEVLVRCVRYAVRCHDTVGRNRLLETLVLRVQDNNEAWANQLLQQSRMPADERAALVGDLCSDLYESLFRAVMDPTRLFWEENFWHSLRYERKHVYRACMAREGRWKFAPGQRTDRIPRSLMSRLQVPQREGSEVLPAEIEDDRAHYQFLSVEHAELWQAVLQLPDSQKTIALLIFWEGRTQKEVAQLLHITDRTVRNRLRAALNQLRAAWYEQY